MKTTFSYRESQKRSKRQRLPYLLLALVFAVGFLLMVQWLTHEPSPQGAINTATNEHLPITNTVDRKIVKLPTASTGEPNLLTIPDIAVTAPVIYIDVINKDTEQEALSRGVVHYPDTAKPGEWGNVYIFGHSSDYAWKPGNYKRIFRPLVGVPLETVVYLSDANGNVFVYRIKETKVVPPNETSVLEQYNYERRILTLQTSYPVGTALKRYIAIAELDEGLTYGKDSR